MLGKVDPAEPWYCRLTDTDSSNESQGTVVDTPQPVVAGMSGLDLGETGENSCLDVWARWHFDSSHCDKRKCLCEPKDL